MGNVVEKGNGILKMSSDNCGYCSFILHQNVASGVPLEV